MSWFSDLFSSTAAAPIDAIGSVFDKLFTTDDERLAAEAVMTKLKMHPAELQVELNKVEAGHRSMFVAGWRPFIGWVCGVALLYNFIIRDILSWYLSQSGSNFAHPPELAMEHLMTILLGMLGLGGLRTVEKLKGKSK